MATVTCSLGHTNPRGTMMLTDCFFRVMDKYHSLQAAVNHGLECSLSSLCHLCEGPQIQMLTFASLPALLTFDSSHQPTITINCSLVITSTDGTQATYTLKGIMYYAN